MSKQQELNKIMKDILEQKICPELADGATQLVFGDGSADADIVFIGEAPGKNEDEKGLPFVGAAGKFLDEMLAGIGMKRGDVYITNIVKYRPPNNRDPYPDEKAAFLPFLRAQIEVIKPKIVATLGRHSMECFLPGQQISRVHGQPKRIRVQGVGDRVQSKLPSSHNNVLEGSARKKRSTEQTVELLQSESTGTSDKAMTQETGRNAEPGSAIGRVGTLVVMPLFHPAAALYNGAMRQTLIDDFAKIPKVLAQI